MSFLFFLLHTVAAFVLAGPCTRTPEISRAEGAYYRKVESLPSREYRGIEGAIVLPHVVFDPQRMIESGPLDRPSVYLGGHAAGHELDAGLSWERVTDHRGPSFAFRPFWRTSNAGGNQWEMPRGTDDIYFSPGETVWMRIEIMGPAKLKLSLRSLDHPKEFTRVFRQDGFLLGPDSPLISFKRVNSIDQFRLKTSAEKRPGERVGNEGAPAIPTNSRASGAQWEEVFLLSTRGARIPLAGGLCREVRPADLASRYERVFNVGVFNQRGGEMLSIVPQGTRENRYNSSQAGGF